MWGIKIQRSFDRSLGAVLMAFTCIFSCGISTAADSVSNQATTTWDPALEVAGDLPAWFPDIALDSAGTVHIVWNTSQTTVPTTPQNEPISDDPTTRDYLMYGRLDSSGSPRETDIGLSHGGEAMR